MSKILQDLNIGANMRKIRKSKQFTQIDVCAKMAKLGRPMLQSTYAQIETGTRNIFVSDLLAFRLAMDVTFDDIFAELHPINTFNATNQRF